MNMNETIALNEKHGKNRMPIEIAKTFWATKQEKVFDDDTIIRKTYDGIKLIESLIKRDTAKKYFQPDNLQLVFRTEVHPKTEKKNSSCTLWMDLIGIGSPEIMYSMTYSHGLTGKSIVYDGSGKILAEEKGWKKLRAHFQTFDIKEEETPETSSKIKKAAKAPVSTVPAEQTAEEASILEIPEELV